MFSGGLAPYSYRLVESISPITGTSSCLFMLFYCIGKFASIFVNDALINRFGARIQPAVIASFCLFLVPIIIVTMCLHQRYQQIRTEVILELESRSGKQEDKEAAPAEETKTQFSKEMVPQDSPATSDGGSNSVTPQSTLSASSVVLEIICADELREYEAK